MTTTTRPSPIGRTAEATPALIAADLLNGPAQHLLSDQGRAAGDDLIYTFLGTNLCLHLEADDPLVLSVTLRAAGDDSDPDRHDCRNPGGCGAIIIPALGQDDAELTMHTMMSRLRLHHRNSAACQVAAAAGHGLSIKARITNPTPA